MSSSLRAIEPGLRRVALDLDDPVAVVLAAVAAFDAAGLDLPLMDLEVATLASELPDHDVIGRYRTVMAD